MKNARTFRGRIFYTMDKRHPDFGCVKNPDEVQNYEDVYTFTTDWNGDTTKCKSYIKNDLRLVAGGGYNDWYIHNVRFEIVEVK